MKKIFKIISLMFLFAIIINLSSCFFNRKKSYFTVRVQNGDASKNIALALDPENEKDYTTGFDAKAIDDFDQTSPVYLFAEKNGKSFAKVNELHNDTPGDINYDKIYGYSFYIVNKLSNQDVSARLKLTMSKDDGLSDAIRIMTYYEASGVQNFKVYQKTDETPQEYSAYQAVENRNALNYFDDGNPLIFDTNNTGDNIIISGTDGKNYIRYTILFWLEGDDPDCDKTMVGKKNPRFVLELSTN